MNEDMIVIGWTDTYISSYPTAEFSEDRKKSLIERIRKRKYDFNFSDYQFLSYCCPIYSDGKICVLNKQQFDNVIKEAWNGVPRTRRLIPSDVIDDDPICGILFEKPKFKEQFLKGEDNGKS